MHNPNFSHVAPFYQPHVSTLSAALLLALSFAGGCSKTCTDDGFAWQQDPSCLRQDSGTTADTAGSGGTETNGSGGDTGDSASASVSGTKGDTVGETGGTTRYCKDVDQDGHGDASDCVDVPQGEDPPPGTVDNEDDCDDGDAFTFPGAAPKDDLLACMRDVDNDDHGDAVPDDPGVIPGNDCNDAQAAVNPTDSVLVTGLLGNGTNGPIHAINPATGALTSFVTLDISNFNLWLPTSLTVKPSDLSLDTVMPFHNNLITTNACGSGIPVDKPETQNKVLCGLSYDNEDNLYGVDGQVDQLIKFKADGSVDTAKDLTLNGETLNVSDCGLTWDCHQQRLLLSETGTSAIYVVDRDTAAVTLIADPQGQELSIGAGLAYEPVSRRVLSSFEQAFYSISIDGTNSFTKLEDLKSEESIDDLEFAPACN